MKKKLQAELKDLANKILKNDQENSTSFLKQQARELYEKLTVLAFTEENLEAITTAKTHSTAPAASETTRQPLAQGAASGFKKEIVFIPQPSIEKEEEKDEYLPDGTEYNEDDSITEPNTEKIKDIVAHMPPETDRMDHMINDIIAKNGVERKPEPTREQKPDIKSDFRNIGVDYDNLPDFEPVKKPTPQPPKQTPPPQQSRPQQQDPSPQQQNSAREEKQEKERPRSLNDRLKKGINIGLNERLAFIRHLFEGKTADYNRVVSQLNTFDSVTEAKKFIELVVKPDYRNWEGKEEYEQRFLDLVENKFRH